MHARRLDARGGEGQLHPKGGALALARALAGHGAPVKLGEMADERQPDAEPALGARAAAVALPEPVEDERQELPIDADAAVADHDLQVRVDALKGDLDPASLRRELDGVHQEVPDNLLDPVRIAAERSRIGVDERLQPEPLGLGGGADRVRWRRPDAP